jgi:hypothetical protein
MHEPEEGSTAVHFGTAATGQPGRLIGTLCQRRSHAEDPDHVRMAARLLGHASLQTTERYYIAANTRSALRRHHDRVLSIRRGTSRGPGRAARG